MANQPSLYDFAREVERIVRDAMEHLGVAEEVKPRESA
jgi:hypothetical protein